MTSHPDAASFDAIVIGSGIGGLACASALSRSGRRVLVLEQHFVAGGLTQTFSREGFTWDVGLHYLGDMHQGGGARRVLDWLADEAIHFSPTGAVYDTVHFPDGVEVQFPRTQAALKLELQEQFPQSRAELESYFAAVEQAARGGHALFAARVMPGALVRAQALLHRGGIERWWGRTTEAVLTELISDPRLRAILCAQRGDYGPDPRESSFGAHALVTHHYFDGAYYPVNGGKAFAEGLVPVIRSGGGEVRTRARVIEIVIEKGTVAGVRTRDGREWRCPVVCSDAGARNTVLNLLPAEWRESPWACEVASFRPAACHVALYLGLQGDIRALGASGSNHWYYDTWDLAGGIWQGPEKQPSAPAVFVSFPSLKQGQAGSRDGRHTADVIVFTDWELFRPWEDSEIGRRPAEYRDLKQLIEQRLVEQFGRFFPALTPLIAYREVSTPLSTVAFTGAARGAGYGLEPSPRRFLSSGLRAQTPVPGLYLAGQDVATVGIAGAMMGGMLAAAAIDPALARHLS
ncbi:MAG: NAD(P)/FAD-dependent oxidoreductase [Deltaproteobacteria bacterium]|nr:MAG: NAD(P)/FAD-dependent oxidoreductase [Deltaproteobacteria bacterium]